MSCTGSGESFLAEPVEGLRMDGLKRMASAYGGVVLVVDDQLMNSELLARRIGQLGHEVLVADDGVAALTVMRERRVDLVLLDVFMPMMDGCSVLKEMKGDPDLRHIPAIMITALEDFESTVKCIELGAEDYLTQPFNPVLLRARVNACLQKKRLADLEQEYRARIEGHNLLLSHRVREQVAEISSGHVAMIFGMSKLAESRDPETGEHLERMREYSRTLARKLSRFPAYRETIDEDFVENIFSASPLHDIGKVGVPDAILRKPGKLTEDEWKAMKLHPTIGAETLREVDRRHPGNDLVRVGIEIAETHHERWDGTGYPYGLCGANIPLSGRILALGDVYDALSSRRCYKEAFDPDATRAIILQEKGKHFDPDVVDAFVECEDEFLLIGERFKDPE